MTQTNLLEAAAEVETLIANARAAIAAGKAVDLSGIEGKMSAIYTEVSGTLMNAGAERVALLAQLNDLMPELNALEAEFTATYGTAG